MALRTTAAKVKEILDTDLSDTVVEAFILGANKVIDEVFEDDTELGSALLAEIERWYAAHLIAATREQQIQKAEAKGAGVTYQGKTGMGLESTQYGQQVLAMDSTGLLRTAATGKRASVYAVTSFEYS